MAQAGWLPRLPGRSPVGEVARPLPAPPDRRAPAWLTGLALALLALAASWELRSSALQAALFSRLAHAARFELAAPADRPALAPPAGPFDHRAGYPQLAERVARLEARGYRVVARARPSASLERIARLGLFPPYAEKPQLGLRIEGAGGAPLYEFLEPARFFPDFDAVPPIVVDTLLFIENRELLAGDAPRRNPAVEWDRLGKAALVRLRGERGPGGSTLATQMEKYRHSLGGVTTSPLEKLRQMFSASLRAYRAGPETLEARRRIAVDYLNSVPLSARRGGPEVFGLGDGLAAWYGADLAEASHLLARPEELDPDLRAAAGLAYARVLSLLVAGRRPTDLLQRDPERLLAQTASWLELLIAHGALPPALGEAAREAAPALRPGEPAPLASDAARARSRAAPVRARLAGLLGTAGFYDLDRLDLHVESTVDALAQQRLGDRVEALRQPGGAAEAGLVGFRLLDPGGADGVAFSLNLYERGEDAHRLRVQIDNHESALDLNDGVMLDYGSTAKLRSLAGHLEAVAALHERWSALPPAERAALELPASDALGRWVLGELRARPGQSLSELLEAALDRRVSAAPARFFTGGGLHRFGNFDPADDARVMSVREAFHRSVNLPFVRLMREWVEHVMATELDADAVLAAPADDPRRQAYLVRFSQEEGGVYLERAYARTAGFAPLDALERLYGARPPSPRAAAYALRAVHPGTAPDALAEALAVLAPAAVRLSAGQRVELLAAADPSPWTLQDLGMLAKLHPLELWLVAHLRAHPYATLAEVLAASSEARLEAYQWLFRSRSRAKQDRRIRTVLERDAFAHIHAQWRATGYPFASLVPSLATALGSSADRPSALAELMGLIVHDGLRVPIRRIERLRFAGDTPYETILEPAPAEPQRVLHAEVSAALRGVLVGSVEQGTALRARGALRHSDGSPAVVGGKTGTGDHRLVITRGGQVVEKRPVARSAAFAFTIDDRWFGVVSATVLGPEAGRHRFTSSLPVQLFVELLPDALPALEEAAAREAPADAPGRS